MSKIGDFKWYKYQQMNGTGPRIRPPKLYGTAETGLAMLVECKGVPVCTTDCGYRPYVFLCLSCWVSGCTWYNIH